MLEYSKIPGAFQTIDPAPAARSAPRPVIRETDRKAWNDERTELLKKLWGEGLSCSHIASRLGGVSRNAVIGKVHRLGLSGRTTTVRLKSGRRAKAAVERRRKQAPPKQIGNPAFRALLAAEPFVSTAEELVIPPEQRKTVDTLEECSCRWPIGDPQHAEFHFCGKQKVKGLPYCEFHARRAFCAADPAKRIGFNNTRRRFGFGREVEIAI
jgi:GcrA cell cycle regulator